MITLFTTPKPFEGHIAVIQRNAITSWMLLHPKPEIILLGNEKGTKEICAEMSLKHIPDVVCNEFDTPLLNDLFEKAQQYASNDLLCYVNADIILMSDFVEMIKQVMRPGGKVIAVGRRINVDITEQLEFNSTDWEKNLCEYASKKGQLQLGGTDYFVFPKGFYVDVSAFAIGRGYWDDWLIWKARKLNARVVNTTEAVMVVHQNHTYFSSKLAKGWKEDVEVLGNWKLNGGFKYFFHRSLPTHIYRQKKIYKRPLVDYFIHIYYRILAYLIQRTYSLRRKLGLYRWWHK